MISVPIYLSPEVERTISFMARVVCVISITSSLIVLFCLLKLTPPLQRSISNYFVCMAVSSILGKYNIHVNIELPYENFQRDFSIFSFQISENLYFSDSPHCHGHLCRRSMAANLSISCARRVLRRSTVQKRINVHEIGIGTLFLLWIRQAQHLSFKFVCERLQFQAFFFLLHSNIGFLIQICSLYRHQSLILNSSAFKLNPVCPKVMPFFRTNVYLSSHSLLVVPSSS